jgi:hypothetical protein
MIRTQQLSNGELTIWNDERNGKMVVTRTFVKLSKAEVKRLQEAEERREIMDRAIRRWVHEN